MVCCAFVSGYSYKLQSMVSRVAPNFFILQSYGIKVGYGGIQGNAAGRDATTSQNGVCCG